MDRLQAYEMFVAVADLGSFSAAARKLRLSPQALTRGVQGLEQHLGQRLFHRSTRAVSLTPQGAVLLPEVRRLLGDLTAAEQTARGAAVDPSGELHVTAPVMFGRLHVVPAVESLLARHDRLDIDLLLVDRNIRLVEEGIDVAVRIGLLPDSALSTVRIGAVHAKCVASPGYLARRGAPQDWSALTEHDLIASTGPRGPSEWRLAGRTGASAAPRRRLRVNTAASALSAAEAGIGIANLLSYQVAEALEQGRLIEVLGPEQPELLPVSLLFDPSRSNAPATRAFIEEMKQRAAEGRWT